MFDLAMEITRDPFLNYFEKESRDSFVNYGLRLLRSTGSFVRKVPIDSVKWNFITSVQDPVVVRAIRGLIARIASPTDEQVLEAQAAIGDLAALNQTAEIEFKKRFSEDRERADRPYRRAIDIYRMANNHEGVKRVLDAIFVENLAHFPFYTIECRLVAEVLDIYGPAGMPKIFALIDQQKNHLAQGDDPSRYDHLKAKLAEAIEKQDFREFRSAFSREGEIPSVPSASISRGAQEFIRRQEQFRDSILEARAQATSGRIATLKQQAADFMKAGDAWNAYGASLDALDLAGLLAAGDFMLKHGDGLNAISPYLAAMVLQDMTTKDHPL
jgi:hypothetical protein